MSPNLKKNVEVTSNFRLFARERGYSAASLSIAWLLSRGPHVLPIPGTRSPKRLEELAQGINLKLTEGDLREIDNLLPVGWAHGDRYSTEQWVGPERYS